ILLAISASVIGTVVVWNSGLGEGDDGEGDDDDDVAVGDL
nr:hypothetical protein [Tanacetum cinerariifolium]